jgi:hypothetical protein
MIAATFRMVTHSPLASPYRHRRPLPVADKHETNRRSPSGLNRLNGVSRRKSESSSLCFGGVFDFEIRMCGRLIRLSVSLACVLFFLVCAIIRSVHRYFSTSSRAVYTPSTSPSTRTLCYLITLRHRAEELRLKERKKSSSSRRHHHSSKSKKHSSSKKSRHSSSKRSTKRKSRRDTSSSDSSDDSSSESSEDSEEEERRRRKRRERDRKGRERSRSRTREVSKDVQRKAPGSEDEWEVAEPVAGSSATPAAGGLAIKGTAAAAVVSTGGEKGGDEESDDEEGGPKLVLDDPHAPARKHDSKA